MKEWLITGPEGLEEFVSANSSYEAKKWIAENYDVELAQLSAREWIRKGSRDDQSE